MPAIGDRPSITASRRLAWNLVIDHVKDRRLPSAEGVVDRVIADLRICERYGVLDPEEGLDHLRDAYSGAVQFAAQLASVLEERGVSIDEPIAVGTAHGWAMVRVQAMLWDHIRTIVQLRALLEERAS